MGYITEAGNDQHSNKAYIRLYINIYAKRITKTSDTYIRT